MNTCIDISVRSYYNDIQGLGDANYVVPLCVADNHWEGQKLSTEKSTIGNEPCIKEVTVLGGFFVYYCNYGLIKQYKPAYNLQVVELNFIVLCYHNHSI